MKKLQHFKEDSICEIELSFNGSINLKKGTLSKIDLRKIIDWLFAPQRNLVSGAIHKVDLGSNLLVFSCDKTNDITTIKGYLTKKNRTVRTTLINIQQDYLLETYI